MDPRAEKLMFEGFKLYRSEVEKLTAHYGAKSKSEAIRLAMKEVLGFRDAAAASLQFKLDGPTPPSCGLAAAVTRPFDRSLRPILEKAAYLHIFMMDYTPFFDLHDQLQMVEHRFADASKSTAIVFPDWQMPKPKAWPFFRRRPEDSYTRKHAEYEVRLLASAMTAEASSARGRNHISRVRYVQSMPRYLIVTETLALVSAPDMPATGEPADFGLMWVNTGEFSERPVDGFSIYATMMLQYMILADKAFDTLSVKSSD